MNSIINRISCRGLGTNAMGSKVEMYSHLTHFLFFFLTILRPPSTMNLSLSDTGEIPEGGEGESPPPKVKFD